MNRLLILLLLSLLGFATHADTVRIAVAANFTAAMRELAEHFESASGYRTVVSFGSTGKLYTQIIHGAPFEVFLSADQDRPVLLEQAGRASGRFTYATGRLVLWSQAAGQDLGPETLSTVPIVRRPSSVRPLTIDPIRFAADANSFNSSIRLTG